MLYTAFAHEHNAVGQGHGLDLVMGDINHGLAQVLVQAFDFAAHLITQLGIQVRQWFIEKVEPCIAHHRTANRHALQLSTRQLTRIAL